MITPIYSPAPGRYENGMKYRPLRKELASFYLKYL